jgi:superfamily II DNA or RNA helicase
MTLRPYQSRAANEILALLHRGKSPLFVLPTRGGKTRVASEVVGTLIGMGWEIGFFVHRIELLRQASKAMTRAGIPHGVLMPGHDLTGHPVHIASIDTVLARLSAGDRAIAAWVMRLRLILPDEAHHFPSDKWQCVRQMSRALLFGVTATPYRGDGQGLGSAGFSAAVRGPSMRELIEGGYLADFDVFAPPVSLDLGKLKLRGGDYAADEVRGLVDNPDFIMMAARAYARFSPGQPCVVFGAGVQHAEHIALGCRRAGWSAVSIDGTTGAEDREQALIDLAADRLNVLASCDLISEGVDLPAVGSAILGRPTKSTQLYMQQAGRPLTPHTDKGRAIIVDLVGNTAVHGMPDAERPWTLDGGVKGLERQVGPTRRCARCWRVHAWAEICPGCGARYPKSKDKTPATLWHLPSVGKMRPELIAGMTVADAARQATNRREMELVAEIKGLDSKWVDRAMSWAGRAA